jgi:hypothetical protein
MNNQFQIGTFNQSRRSTLNLPKTASNHCSWTVALLSRRGFMRSMSSILACCQYSEKIIQLKAIKTGKSGVHLCNFKKFTLCNQYLQQIVPSNWHSTTRTKNHKTSAIVTGIIFTCWRCSGLSGGHACFACFEFHQELFERRPDQSLLWFVANWLFSTSSPNLLIN